MTKDYMINYVKDHMKEYLPESYQDADVSVITVDKLNGSYKGLSIRRPDEIMVPTINLDDILKDAESREDLDSVMERISELMLKDRPSFNLERIDDYSKAKPHLFTKLVNREYNAEFAKDLPHVDIEDLMITFHLMLSADEENTASTTVTNTLMKMWGIDQETLYKDALRNTQAILPARICSLAEQLSSMGFPMPEEDSPLVMVSNEKGVFGASVLFYPGVLEKISDRLKGSYYMLPSSLHEVLVLPEDSCEVSVEDMHNMVMEINATQVEPEEKLSDSVYFYNADEKVFKKIA